VPTVATVPKYLIILNGIFYFGTISTLGYEETLELFYEVEVFRVLLLIIHYLV